MVAVLHDALFLVMLAITPGLAARVGGTGSIRHGNVADEDASPAELDFDSMDDGSNPSFIEAADITENDTSMQTSLAQLESNSTRREDVECFCLQPYLYSDLDDEEVETRDCTGRGNDYYRCDNICQRHGKIVLFEGMRQTLSFCGGDHGEPYSGDETECQCFDPSDTLGEEGNKKKGEKLWRKGKLQSRNEVWMVKRMANYHGFHNPEKNLKACYAKCPTVCHDHYMNTAGCAFPMHH